MCSDSGGSVTDPGATFGFTSTGCQKCFAILFFVQVKRLAIENLVYFGTGGMPYLFLEFQIHFTAGFHGLLVRFGILDHLRADDLRNSHDSANQCATRFAPSGDSTGQATGRFEDAPISEIQRFLQSCKNGLASSAILHFIL